MHAVVYRSNLLHKAGASCIFPLPPTHTHARGSVAAFSPPNTGGFQAGRNQSLSLSLICPIAVLGGTMYEQLFLFRMSNSIGKTAVMGILLEGDYVLID